MNGRHDHAVILARGASRRMGRPKGLCRRPGASRTLLETVVQLYLGSGWPVAVVTTPALADLYRTACPEAAPVLWIEQSGGGGTARTCLAAVAALDSVATHLWLHPVDLPDVRPQTLQDLRVASEADPEAILIPHHGSRRGHPVVLPCGPWRGLDPLQHPEEMRELISATGCRKINHAVRDAGVVQDVDDPAALGRELPGTGRS